MRRLHYFGWRQRKGIALLLVMFIAFASLVLLTTLFSSLAPRSISVRGQAQSDRALAIADGTIDRLLNQINNAPGLTQSFPSTDSNDTIGKALVAELLLGINGGSSGDSFDVVSTNVRHYFYDIQTDTYYVLKNDGDPVGTGIMTNLSTGVDVAGGFTGTGGIDPTYASDNRWFQLDTNAQYWIKPGVTPDSWQIGVTAFNLSNPGIKRTIRAEAQRGNIGINPVETDIAKGNWYVAGTETGSFFSDYSGLYHSKVNFGQFEVVTGQVRSDSDLHMGGWAKDIASASGTVSDDALDDGNAHDGRFGISSVDLYTAKTQGLVVNGVSQAKWNITGPDALANLSNAATSDYKSGNATIVFSVVGAVGKVKINNGDLLNLPTNGAIYVNGDATVSGIVKGQVTIGANDDIYIGDDITYNTAPWTDKVNQNPVASSLQDKLGLIARSDIIIPVLTYNAKKTLTIDAAMLAVNGYFGLDQNANYSSHSINSKPHWVGNWNGSQSMYDGSSAPAMSNGSGFVTGYEEQHTNYDYNFSNGARPPFFPAVGDTSSTKPVYNVPYSGSNLATLQSLTVGQLQPTALTYASNPTAWAENLRYSYALSGTTYYYGPDFNVSTYEVGTYAPSNVSLYRVSWKEEIAQPVVDPTP